MILTNEQILQADAALQELGSQRTTQVLALKVARMRYPVLRLARDLNDVRQKDGEARAERNDSGTGPKVRTTEAGGVVFVLNADEQYQSNKEWQETMKATVEVEVEVLCAADFPAKVAGEEFTVAPNVLVGLGPLFSMK